MKRTTEFSTYVKIFFIVALTLIGISACMSTFSDMTARIYFALRTTASIIGQIPLIYICIRSTRHAKRFVTYGATYILFMLTTWQVNEHLSETMAVLVLVVISIASWLCLLPVCRRIEGESYGNRRKS